MPRYGMVIDITKCSGCYNCVLACKDEYCGHEYPGYSAAQPMTGHYWMNLIKTERGQYPKVKVAYTPVPCMHCREAPCIAQAQNGAVYRRPDGIVIIDPVKAKGQRQLLSACPYGVIYWNEEEDLPQKCTFCAHLLDQGWKEPRCVELCPSGALIFGDLDDPQSEVARLIASNNTEVLFPELGLKENVVYLGIPKRFIAGTVAYADTDEVAAGVTVTLTKNGVQNTVITNNFGDFEFEGLASDSEYLLEIEAPQYKTHRQRVKIRKDMYLGVIMLQK
jgi:Fe-S-cluster-containing dehydrogenase component